MKLLFGAAILLVSATANAGFIHPLDFDGSESQKQEVISYIQARVKADYCDGQLDMCQPTTLRIMEKQNLTAFKKLTKVSDRKILDRVIKDYCQGALDMCTYTTLEIMYKQNVKATKQELSW